MAHDVSQLDVLVELLSRSARGDDKAFARLYRLTAPKLYASALRILKYEDRAQECLQEALSARQGGPYDMDDHHCPQPCPGHVATGTSGRKPA